MNDRYKTFLSVLLLVPLFFLNFSDSFSFAKNISFSLIFPIIKTLDSVTHKTFSLSDRFFFPHWLVRENQKLNEQIDRLENSLIFLRELEDENTRLRDLLHFRRKIIGKTLPAQVIGRDSSQWRDCLMIDKGTKENVCVKMPVLSNCGLLGMIIESGASLSRMILTTDSQFKVSAILQTNRVEGIVYGQGHGKLKMRYVDLDIKIYPYDIVLTSGLGGVFPKGLVLGSVKKITKTEDGLFQEIEMTPSFHFSSLEEVLVLTSQMKGK